MNLGSKTFRMKKNESVNILIISMVEKFFQDLVG